MRSKYTCSAVISFLTEYFFIWCTFKKDEKKMMKEMMKKGVFFFFGKTLGWSLSQQYSMVDMTATIDIIYAATNSAPPPLSQIGTGRLIMLK